MNNNQKQFDSTYLFRDLVLIGTALLCWADGVKHLPAIIVIAQLLKQSCYLFSIKILEEVISADTKKVVIGVCYKTIVFINATQIILASASLSLVVLR